MLNQTASKQKSGALTSGEAALLNDRILGFGALQRKRNSGSASVLPTLQKRVIDGQLEEEQDALHAALDGELEQNPLLLR